MSAKERPKDTETPASSDAAARKRTAAGKVGKAGTEDEPLDEESLDHVLREAPL